MAMTDPSPQQTVRGLLVKPQWTFKFVPGEVVWEVRSFNCNVLKKGDECFLIETAAGQNSHKIPLLKVVGKLRFIQNLKKDNSVFSRFFDKHKVSTEEFAKLRASQTRQTDFWISWEFEVLERFETPLYIPWGNDLWMDIY